MPITLEKFVDSLSISGLMTAEELKSLREGVAARQPPPDAESLARDLVREGKLTKFQARALYEGKAKGLVCGDYVLLDRIGAGGMGQVYTARHKRMNRVVALKLLVPRATTTVEKQKAVKRLYQEVELAARLLHPNIVVSYDAGESSGLHYLVMELVEGQDVSTLLKPDKKLPLDQALDIIVQAGRGLEYAHSQGVIHRDIKPSNLLMDKQGKVKILDMGLARAERDLAGGDPEQGLTGTGEIMGTVDYMPPEQSRNTREADARSDIYSLGCTLYRLLTGKVPFGGNSAVEKILAHSDRPIPVLGASSRLQHAFERMLAKKPEDRFPNMTAVIAELEACRANVPEEEHPPLVTDEPPAPSATGSLLSAAAVIPPTDEEASARHEGNPLQRISPRVWMFAGGGLAALVLVGALIALLLRDKSQPTPPVAQGDAAREPGEIVKPAEEAKPSGFSKAFPLAEPAEKPSAPTTVNPSPGAVASVTPKPEPATSSTEPATLTPAGQPAALPPAGIDLLRLVDLKRDDLDGTWRADGSALVCELPQGDAVGRLQLPYAPPAEYDLAIEAEMLSDDSGALTLVLVVGSSRVGFTIAQQTGVTGLGELDGMHYSDKNNPTRVESALSRRAGQPLTIACQVRPTSVAIALNGRQVVDWKGNPQQFSVSSNWVGPDKTKLCVYARKGVRFTNYELLPPGGQSRRIPPEGINLLKLLDLKRDVDAGMWSYDGTTLATTIPRTNHSLEFPHIPPPEYDLHVEVQATTRTHSATMIGLVVGESRVAFTLDPRIKQSGLGLIRGVSGTDPNNPTFMQNAFGLVPGQPMTIVCQVRPTSIRVTLAGRPVAEWNGDPKDLSVTRAGNKAKLFLSCYGSEEVEGVRFTRYELLPPGGVPRSKEVEVAAATAKSGVRVNLLPLIDVKRDAVKDAIWTFDGGALLQAPGAAAKSHTLQIPVRVPAEYELRVVAEPLVSGIGSLKVGLVAGSSRAAFTVVRSNKTSGLEEIQGKDYSDNETTVRRLRGLEQRLPMTIVCTVRATGIRVLLNGQQVVDWKGDFKQLSVQSTGGFSAPPDKSKLFLTSSGGDQTGSFRITKLELVPLGAKPGPVPPTPAIAAALLTVQGLAGDLPKNASALQRTDVARRLHEQAASTDDDALRYASLTEAVKLATAGDDLRLVLDLVEDLQRCFEMDATSILNASLGEIANRTRPPNDRKELLFKFLEMGEAEIAAERYDSASLLVKTASLMVAKSADADLKKEVRNREQEVTEWQKLFAVADPAQQTLHDHPENFEANLALGTYLAVARDDWPAALARLAKGSDALVSSAALAESREQQDPNRLANIGALWLDAAEKAEIPAKAVYLERSRKWLAQGASKLKPAELTKLQSRYKKVETDVRRVAGTAFVKRHPLRAASFGGHWYQYMPEYLTWHQARQRCQDMGGDLVCLEAAAEAQFVYQLASLQAGQPKSLDFWLGGTEEGHDRVFTWVSGAPFQFTNWGKNEPDLTSVGEAVAVQGSGVDVHWHDAPTTQHYYVVCEWER